MPEVESGRILSAMNRDERIDAYIADRAEFARPILQHIRAAVHAACPAVEESIKWGMPAFGYKGRPLANMAAFKAHATVGLAHAQQLRGDTERRDAMGDFGRVTSIADLPPTEELTDLIRQAAALIDAGVKEPRARKAKPPIDMPDDLAAALAAEPSAQARWDAFPPGCKREYLEWVTGAKRAETRAARIEKTVAQAAEGKKLNWRYEGC